MTPDTCLLRRVCLRFSTAANTWLFAAFLIVPSGSAQAENSQSVTLAIAGPMAGTSFTVGAQYRAGVLAALERLPDGKLLGREVEVVTQDDNCDSKVAKAVALNLVQRPPAVVIGHSCSSATIVAAPIYAQNKVLQITPASTNPKVTEMGIPTLFRMIGRDDMQGRVAAERIVKRHAGKRLAVVHFPGGYSTGLATTAINELKIRGVELVKVVVSEASATSYASEIQDLIDTNTEVIYIVGGGLDTGLFIRQARQMGAEFDILSSDTLVSKVFTRTAGDAADGVPFTFPPEAAQRPESAPAIAALEKQGVDPVGYTLLAYAAVETWIEGVRRANTFDAEAVAGAIRSKPLQNILGTVSFDEKGDIITDYAPFDWFVWKQGQRINAD